MIATALIALREGLEAALVVGIMLGYLRKTGQAGRSRYAWAGVVAAAALSLILALAIQMVGMELQGRAEQLFEGVTMLFAVAILTWMVFWMRRQARSIKGTLEQEMQLAIATGQSWGLVAVAFAAVFREGVETALLLSAAAFASNGLSTLLGALVGLSLAVFVGYLIYASSMRLNVRLFFSVTSALLLLFGAGLLARSIHEFQEAGLISTLNEHVWNTSGWLSETSALGTILQVLVGYTSQPSLEMVISYGAYWIIALFGVRWWGERTVAHLQLQAN